MLICGSRVDFAPFDFSGDACEGRSESLGEAIEVENAALTLHRVDVEDVSLEKRIDCNRGS